MPSKITGLKKIDGPQISRWIQLLKWTFDPIGYMESNAQRYGDVFTSLLIAGSKKVVFVSNPEALREILTKDSKELSAPGEENRIVAPLLGDYSIAMLDGAKHRGRRKLLMPSFHGERLQNYGQLICDLTEKIFDQQPLEERFRVRDLTQKISLQVILEVVFGFRDGERTQEIARRVAQMLDVFNSPTSSIFLLLPVLQKNLGRWSPWGYFLHLRSQLDQLLFEEINERREKGDSEATDILALLLAVQDENGESLTNQEVRDELVTLLFAGHETTATALSWALYWTHHLPEVGEKVRQELQSLGDNPDPLEIFKLPYLTAVCNETLRIYPVGMLTFARIVKEPMEIAGYEFTPDMSIAGCIYLTHQREDLYPQPKEFKPERFLERQFSAYEFMPFGGGVRRCLGEVLALFELKLVLATILSRYQLALADDKPEKPHRRGLTLAPTKGVRMVIKENSKLPRH